MRGHGILAEPVAEVPRDALRQLPCVHEHQRGPVCRDERGQAVVVLLPDLVRHHGLEGGARQLDAEVHSAPVADVDDGAAGRIAGGEEAGDLLDGRLGGGQPDALQCGCSGDGLQPLERQREVCSTPRTDDRVDLVHDDRAHGAKHLPAAVGREEQIQRFRRRHEDVRRRPQHRRPLRLRGIAGPHGGSDPGRTQPGLFGQAVNARARLREVLVNVGAERLQRRHVDDAHLVRQRRRTTLFEQPVDGGEKGRQCLA